MALLVLQQILHEKILHLSVLLKAAVAPTNSKLVKDYCYVFSCCFQKCLLVTGVYLIMPVMLGFKA